jgi:hypothetical protein
MAFILLQVPVNHCKNRVTTPPPPPQTPHTSRRLDDYF